MDKKQYIKKLFENKPIMLAPMAGYTDIGFRYLCKKYGADIVFTEMINVSALCYKNKKTFDMLQFLPYLQNPKHCWQQLWPAQQKM